MNVKNAAQYLIKTDHWLIEMARRYVIFATGGGISLLLALGITSFSVEMLRAPFWIAYAFGLAVAILFAFVFHTFVTFRNKSSWKNRFAKFTLVVLVLALANWALSTVLEAFLSVHYIIIIFFVTTLLSIVNYGLNRWWVFARA